MKTKKMKVMENPFTAGKDMITFAAVFLIGMLLIRAGGISAITFFKQGVIGSGENDSTFSAALYFSATAPVKANDLYQRGKDLYVKKDFLDPYLKEEQEKLLKEFLFMNAYPVQQVTEKTGFQIYDNKGELLQAKDISTIKNIINRLSGKESVGYLIGKDKMTDLENAILENKKFVADQKEFYQENKIRFVSFNIIAPIGLGFLVIIGYFFLIIRKYKVFDMESELDGRD